MSQGLKNMKKKHIKAVSQKVKLFRASDPLLSVLMWGINHSINELSHINIPVMLMSDDFKAYSKVKVDNHLFNKENLPSHFKVKEYCPLVFRNLRERFNINDTDFLNSFTFSAPAYDDWAGKSGSKFMMSADKKYVIKTISSEEVGLFHELLKDYHKYIVEIHGETLLPQYLGMYRLTVDGTETYMIIMRGIFSSTLAIHRKYDLKGSTVDRQASDKEKAKDFPTYKDQDFLKENNKIYVGAEAKHKLIKTLEHDVEFLTRLKLMDYSLLAGIHDVAKAEQEERERLEAEEKNGYNDDEDSGSGETFTPPDSPMIVTTPLLTTGEFDLSEDLYAIKSSKESPKEEVYFLGLIDILTHWGARKKAAMAAKTVKHGAGAEISSVNPEQYAKRFLEFIVNAVE
ncbi:phosphatidylinositol 5-phosphate 4-kinase type-2 alpha-like [Anneissia japonica]|uniref:phosphatidylinositol 5-phosphate 4-kinase type-2 alpha-like n=1 Tax=Anneissia japonica TaxID=1529436 RepID=UPI00142567D3|nr:phosphatidylinositol 5-phosphate 4-kinase type-2 alpha-like [Anneissia japonica]